MLDAGQRPPVTARPTSPVQFPATGTVPSECRSKLGSPAADVIKTI